MGLQKLKEKYFSECLVLEVGPRRRYVAINCFLFVFIIVPSECICWKMSLIEYKMECDFQADQNITMSQVMDTFDCHLKVASGRVNSK